MIVDHSLTDYHHLHPQYDPQRKLFVCQFTPQLSQSYTVWHDVTRAQTHQQAYLRNALDVAGSAPIPPSIAPTSQVATDDLRVSIQPDAPLRAGKDGMLMVEVRGRMGEPLHDLEPLMGAYAHLVGFSQDGQHIVHCHPMGDEPISEADRGSGVLHFHITPEMEGKVKFFLQVKRNGHETTIPFGQAILPNDKFTSRVGQSRQQHATMAMG